MCCPRHQSSGLDQPNSALDQYGRAAEKFSGETPLGETHGASMGKSRCEVLLVEGKVQRNPAFTSLNMFFSLDIRLPVDECVLNHFISFLSLLKLMVTHGCKLTQEQSPATTTVLWPLATKAHSHWPSSNLRHAELVAAGR